MNDRKKIIIVDSVTGLKGLLSRALTKSFYVNLVHCLIPADKDLLDSLNVKDLTKEIFINTGAFKDEYMRFMRVLNRKTASIRWWSMNFTNKTPLLTSLYADTFYFCRLSELACRLDFDRLFIFTSNRRLAKELKKAARAIGAAGPCALYT